MPTPIVRSPSLTSTSKRSLRSSTTSRSLAWTVQLAPSAAAATCLTQTSKPTVALPVAQLLEGEHRRRSLHHPDHPRSRENARADRAADVGHQPAFDQELVRALRSHLERHQPTIPMPPETPMHSPVT